MIIVDRIENGYAVCEIDNEYVNISLEQISGNLREGSVLEKCGEQYVVSDSDTDKRKIELFEKQKRLFGK